MLTRKRRIEGSQIVLRTMEYEDTDRMEEPGKGKKTLYLPGTFYCGRASRLDQDDD